LVLQTLVAACLGLVAAALVVTPLAAQQRKVYVTNEFDNSVSVIDANPSSGTFNTVIATPTVGSHPRPLAASPDGSWVYVVNRGVTPNTVSVISTVTDAAVATITVGTTARIAFRGDSAFAYAINEDSNNVTVIDTATMMVVSTLNVGLGPRDGATCPSSPYGLVFDHGSNDVTIIDGINNVVAATVPVGGEPLFGVFRPDCAFAFITTAANTLVAIDMSSLTAVATLPLGTNPVWAAVRPDGAFLYTANKGTNDICIIGTANPPFTEISQPPVGTAPVSGGMRPDGAFLFVINQGSNSVSVVDTSSNIVLATPIAVGSFPAAGVMRPDGSTFAVLNLLSRDVSVIDTTSDLVLATLFFGWDLDPDFHPDITADTNWLYVPKPVSNTVVAGDLVNFVVPPDIPVGTRPTHAAVAQIGP
jgi:YVTN family beta-propeller protein